MGFRRTAAVLSASAALLGSAAAGTAASAAAGPLTAAHRAVSEAVCNIGGYSQRGCMNRSGGGTSNGTRIIDYNADFDNNENFALSSASGYVCGQYSTVHNGENGCVGPFLNGSGLNARYDGRPVVFAGGYGSQAGKCAAFPAQPGMTLQPCGANGTYDAVSSLSYLINVYQSNQAWLDGFNNPAEFVCGSAGAGQVSVALTGASGTCQWTNQGP